jgi:4-hydroxy-tetrahydrodipicolinate synthase
MLDQIRGLVCPMVTPFDEAGAIDHGAVAALVDFLLDRGVQVLFPAGSTGEGLLLSVEERKALAETVLNHTAGRAPVIVHTGAMRTDETIELTRHAREAGATAASIITPFFFTYTDDSIFEHYVAVARAVAEFPLFVYVFPGNAKHDVSPELLQRLRRAAPNLVGVKSSNPQLLRLQEYIAVGGEGFVPLCGVDGLMLAGLAIGSRGQVSGNSNVWPEIFRRLYDAFCAGDLATTRDCQSQIDRLRAIVQDGLHPAAFKAGLALRGLPGGRVRSPMRELSPTEQKALAASLQELGIV